MRPTTRLLRTLPGILALAAILAFPTAAGAEGWMIDPNGLRLAAASADNEEGFGIDPNGLRVAAAGADNEEGWGLDPNG